MLTWAGSTISNQDLGSFHEILLAQPICLLPEKKSSYLLQVHPSSSSFFTKTSQLNRRFLTFHANIDISLRTSLFMVKIDEKEMSDMIHWWVSEHYLRFSLLRLFLKIVYENHTKNSKELWKYWSKPFLSVRKLIVQKNNFNGGKNIS